MYKKILLAIDLEQLESSQKVLATASEFARKFDAEVWALTVVMDPSSMIIPSLPDSITEHLAHAAHEANEKLKELIAKEVDDEVICHPLVRHDSVYRQVLAVAEEQAVDIIVIGAHHPELSDYLLGTNSAKIVRHAKCSVFIVREP